MSRASKPAQETERTRDLSNDQLHQEQQFMLQSQDRHLDDILTGVTRLKVIGCVFLSHGDAAHF